MSFQPMKPFGTEVPFCRGFCDLYDDIADTAPGLPPYFELSHSAEEHLTGHLWGWWSR